MRIPNLRHITAFSLIAALLAVGGMACFLSSDDDAAATSEIIERLDEVDKRSTDSLIKQELLSADVTRLKESNLELTGRVDQLQQENKEQAGHIEALQVQAATTALGGAAAPPAAAITDPAAMDDATALKRFIECTVKTANPGADAASIAMASGFAETAFMSQIQSGTTSYDEIRQQIPLVCAGQ